MRKTTALLMAVLVAVASFRSVQAQSPSPTTEPRFEVASVKPSKPGFVYGSLPDWLGRNTFSPPGSLPLGALIGLAFDTNQRIVGLPDWTRTEDYVINAKAEDGVILTREELRPRLRQLLVERFKLAAHIATTYADGYALVLAKGGPKLKETPNPLAMVSLGLGRMRAPSVSMDVLARGLGMVIRQPVINETGLPGNYEFTLTFAPEGATDSALPSIFTALEEQLGLKLEGGRKLAVDTLVIDHVEPPTED
jgi:uncharacterized protein (TIGR03435 family)